MRDADLKAGYQLISELLLSPDERDADRVATLQTGLGAPLTSVSESIARFLGAAESDSHDEYLQTLELSPPCPLYLGSHIFDEPTTCNGIGSSGRNAYMLELIGLYQHFELDLTGKELPDFLPVVVDFLWISLEGKARDRIALRRWCLEHHVQPALGPLSESLTKYGSPYQYVIEALRETVEEDLRRMEETPAWKPPQESKGTTVSLQVLEESEKPFPETDLQMSHSEFRP